jgi:hypothetical protein
MLQALRAIVHAPSADLAPAVQRQVVHLVSHKSYVPQNNPLPKRVNSETLIVRFFSADVRRLALAALSALADHSPNALEGLRDRKIWKRLRDQSPAVALQAVKVTRKMLAVRRPLLHGLRRIEPLD